MPFTTRFTNKVVIITGSSSGIGQATAVVFAEEGASMVIHGQNKERLEQTERLLLGKGIPLGRIHKVYASLEDADAPGKIVDETVAKFGRIDVLINNAGVFAKPGQTDPNSIDALDFMYNINLRSAILLTQLALPHLERSGGNVLSVSSALSTRQSLSVFYSLLKAALDHWTRAMAQQWAPKGVRFNCVNPGATNTFIFARNGFVGELMKLHKKWVKKGTPMARYGEPAEIAAALKFLASREASFVTGQCLAVDGGFSIASLELGQMAGISNFTANGRAKKTLLKNSVKKNKKTELPVPVDGNENEEN